MQIEFGMSMTGLDDVAGNMFFSSVPLVVVAPRSALKEFIGGVALI